MPTGPDINADRQAAREKEEQRITFLRQCAVSFASGSRQLFDFPDRATAAKMLVADWSALHDAIETTRKR